MPHERITESEILYRDFTIDPGTVDEAQRTVQFSFSSETPVERDFGMEILDHGPSSVRLGRLRAGGPLLMDHDTRDLVGVIDQVEVGSDKKGRVRAKFSKSARASEIYQEVLDGIRRNVSVGYRVHRMTLDHRGDDIDTYRVTDWEPYEVSMVSVPADVAVGVGRQSSHAPNTVIIEGALVMPENQPNQDTLTEQQMKDMRATMAREIEESNLKRIRDLETIGKQFPKLDGPALAAQMIREGNTPEELREALMQRFEKSGDRALPPESKSRLDLSPNDQKRYSLIRAVNAHISNNWTGAEFERECSIEIADRVGRDPRGFFVPLDVQVRDLTKATAADLVGTDHLAAQFIDALRPMSVVMDLGATVMHGLLGDVDIPKLTAGATFYWVADDGNVTDSDPTFGSVSLSPKTVAGSVPMSRRLLKQSNPSVEQVVLDDLRRGAALAIDSVALEGGGANQPSGITSVVGVNTQTIAASATTGYPTFPELVGFETKVADDNALTGSLAYVTTSAIAGGLKTTAKDAGSGTFLLEKGEANGYPVRVRNGITAKRIIFGNFRDVLIGLWGILDVYPDPAAKAAAGGLVLRVFQDIDVAVRHAESFCINA